MSGYVKLYRSIEDWEWYDDPICLKVFIHLMLKVNREPKRWKGMDIPAGQLITSLQGLAERMKMDRHSLRRILKRMESTGEVNIQTNNHFTSITLVKWAEYQNEGGEFAQQNAQPTRNQRATNAQPVPTTKEDKKLRREETISNEIVAHTNSIEIRLERFKAKCREVIQAAPDRLPPDERKPFLAYWTEANEKGRMRFEMEKVFDHGRRMDTWMKNAANGSRFQPQPKPQPVKEGWRNG
jgi:hypothetical protein